MILGFLRQEKHSSPDRLPTTSYFEMFMKQADALNVVYQPLVSMFDQG